MESESQEVTKEELEKLPKEAIVAFAARCALRVLPAFTNSDNFNKLKNFRKHLINIEKAIHVAIGFSLGQISAAAAKKYAAAADAAAAAAAAAADAAADVAAAAAAAAADAAYADAAAAAYAAYAAAAAYAYAAAAAYADAAAAAAYADAAADVAADADAAAAAARDDYNYLVKYSENNIRKVLLKFYSNDLWLGNKPKEWYQVENKFQNVLKDINCYEIFERYKSGGVAYIDLPFEEDDETIKKLENKTSFSITSNIVKPTLDVKKHAQVLYDIIAKFQYDKGQFIGIFGQWGRGKTYFWDQVNELVDIKSFETEIFHAWKYQDTPASWAYLYEILADKYFSKPEKLFKRGWGKYWFRRIRLGIKRGQWKTPTLILLLSIILSIVVFNIKSLNIDWENYYLWLLPILPTLSFLIEKYKKDFSTKAIDIFQKFSKKVSFEKHLGAQAEIQKELVKLLQVWFTVKINDEGKEIARRRLLLFVDDVDRCEESKIIQIVDALRVMLENDEIVKRMIVVAAVDERILGRVIYNKYYELMKKSCDNKEFKEKLKERVREQFDKLFIIGIKLSKLNNEQFTEFFNKLTESTETRKVINEVDILSVSKKEIEDKQKREITNVKGKDNTKNLNNESSKNDEGDEDRGKSTGTTKQIPEEVKSEYEIEQYEKRILDDIIKIIPEATPRQLRIWYYRYLLATRLLRRHKEPAKSKFTTIEQLLVDYSKLVAVLLIEYGLVKDFETFEKEKTDYLRKDVIISINALDGKYKFECEKKLLEQIFEILEIVIAY